MTRHDSCPFRLYDQVRKRARSVFMLEHASVEAKSSGQHHLTTRQIIIMIIMIIIHY